MATNYSKLKNAELEDLLRARSLPHTGKKADLIARLQQHDLEHSSAAQPQLQAASKSNPSAKSSGGMAGADDVIDWEDDGKDNGHGAVESTATNATVSTAARAQPLTAVATAGGQRQTPNPTAASNQVPAIDPSKTSDLTVHKPSSANAPQAFSASSTAQSPTDAGPSALSGFMKGLSTTSLDTELEKRKARAARFGLVDVSTTESVKALERAKRFGLEKEKEGDKVVESIDSALPERRKRGRDPGNKGEAVEGDGEERAGKRQDSQRREARGGKGRGEGRRNTSKGRANGTVGGAGGGTKKSEGKISEADRLAAEARKKRFAAAT